MLSGEPIAAKGVNQKDRDMALQGFLQILVRKMPTICGRNLELKLIPTADRVPRLTQLTLFQAGITSTKRKFHDEVREIFKFCKKNFSKN